MIPRNSTHTKQTGITSQTYADAHKQIQQLVKNGKQEAILPSLSDFRQKKWLNEINKAPAVSRDGGHKLKLIHKLYIFLVTNYVENIFLPSLEKILRESLFMFSFGRMFSQFNDIGVQACTDFDFNIILLDKAETKRAELEQKLQHMKQVLWQEFGIEMELNAQFTVLLFSELKNRISKKNKEHLKYILFYKSIEDNFHIFWDNSQIRTYLKSVTQSIPDLFIFEQYLGLFSSNKNSFFRIKRGDPLEIIPDNGMHPQLVSNVIGSELFRKRLKTGSLLLLNRVSEEWYFSMKYMVNRVYDYVCAMRARGYDLSSLGIEEHDYDYIRRANLIMLILQELKFDHLSLDRFGVQHSYYDFSYISSQRIQSFSTIHPVRFGEAIHSIIYDLKIIPRHEDLRRIGQYVKKRDFSQALWFICSIVEFWISKKVAKLLRSEVLAEIHSQKTYRDFLAGYSSFKLPGGKD